MSTVTFTAIEKLATYKWKYTYTGLAPFQIYHGGSKIESDYRDTSYILEWHGNGIEPPVLEIQGADDTGDVNGVKYPGRILMQWRGNPLAARYSLQKNISGTWQEQDMIIETGAGYYQYQTDIQDDVTEHEWRVVAYDSYGNATILYSETVFIARNPDPLQYNWSYSYVGIIGMGYLGIIV